MLQTRLLFFCFFLVSVSYGQSDSLPEFFVWKKNKAIGISWTNTYPNITQINIQRTKDSNRNYITIHSCPQPIGERYTFTDITAKHDSMYYRVFLLFDDATYSFTKPKRPKEEQATFKKERVDQSASKNKPGGQPSDSAKNNSGIPSNDSKGDIPEEKVNVKSKILLPESIHLKTATLEKNWREFSYKIGKVRIKLKENPKKIWQPSVYVYTGDDGNIIIDLPDVQKKKYSLTVGREDGRPLFTIEEINEPKMKIDKSFFLRSGWYYFILRENGNIKERNRFLITRDY